MLILIVKVSRKEGYDVDVANDKNNVATYKNSKTQVPFHKGQTVLNDPTLNDDPNRELTAFEKKMAPYQEEFARIMNEGYGEAESIKLKRDPKTGIVTDARTGKPVDPVMAAQVINLGAALKSGEHPERVSVKISPKPFDKKKWDSSAEFRKFYIEHLEPGRIHQSASDSKAPMIETKSNRYQEIEQNTGEAYLEIIGKAGYPVSAYSFDMGEFSNRLVAQTLVFDSSGKAIFRFKGLNGTISDCNILVSSPVCRNQLKFIVNIRIEKLKKK